MAEKSLTRAEALTLAYLEGLSIPEGNWFFAADMPPEHRPRLARLARRKILQKKTVNSWTQYRWTDGAAEHLAAWREVLQGD